MIPTSLAPAFMSSIMQAATMPYSKATFTFVSSHCEKFILTEFAFSYA
jgi:hypothetical protein